MPKNLFLYDVVFRKDAQTDKKEGGLIGLPQLNYVSVIIILQEPS
jgi:hypothetical protein